ncbi:MAG: hypothetical protein V4772_06865 [Pseudomonadota bacterium]
MSAEILLEQAVAFVRRSFTTKDLKTCEEYGGEFSAAEIPVKSYNCPAIFITVLGWQPPPKGARMGAARHVKQYRLAAFVSYEHADRKKRLKGAMALAEQLSIVLRQWAPMTELQNANLEATIQGLDYEPKVENMYSRAFDAVKQAMFLVSWYQCAKPAVPLGPGRPAVPYSDLPDLLEVEINDTVRGGQAPDLSPPDNDADILVEESVEFAFVAAPPAPPPPPPAPPQTMLLDYFNGSGSAEGRTPDIGYPGVVWLHSDPANSPPSSSEVVGGRCQATLAGAWTGGVTVRYPTEVFSDFLEVTYTVAIQAGPNFLHVDSHGGGYLLFEVPNFQFVVEFQTDSSEDGVLFFSRCYTPDLLVAEGINYRPPVAVNDIFEFVVKVTADSQQIWVNGVLILDGALPFNLTEVKPTFAFKVSHEGWSLLSVNAVCDGAADIPVPPVGCSAAPIFNGRYWVPPFVAGLDEQPVFPVDREMLIDLAPGNLVTSGVSHSSGFWCFEFELERIWAYGDREHEGAMDLTVERSWLYGGIVSCADLSANLPAYRSVFATNGEGAAAVNSTFSDYTNVGGLPAMTFSEPGSVRLGCEVNLSTGYWAFYGMNGEIHASGNSPDIVGAPMLAAVASMTSTPGFYHLQSLYLDEGTLMAGVRPGTFPWNF